MSDLDNLGFCSMKVSDPFFIVGEAIRLKVERHGSLRAAAKVLGVSAPYLCRFRHGQKRNPSDQLLRKLGLTREVKYVWSHHSANEQLNQEGK